VAHNQQINGELRIIFRIMF